MASNEATFRVVAEAEKIFDRVMKAKHPDYAQDVEEAVKLHRARLAAEYAAADHTDIKDYIVPVTRMRDYSEPRPSVTTEVDSQTLQVWMQLAGIGKEPARKQLSEVIGKVGNKEMLRRMQAVAQSKKDIFSNDQIENIISGLRQPKPTTFSDEEMREWANTNKITVEEMALRIKTDERAGTLDYLRPWTASPIHVPYIPLKPTPLENVRVSSKIVTMDDYENERKAQAVERANELMYKQHVNVDGLELSNLSWVTVTVQPLWFPRRAVKNVLASFDTEVEYVHSHVTGHWWSGYTIIGYFYDRTSAERAAQELKKNVCWDGYIEHQRPKPPMGSGGHACRTHSNGDGTKTTYA